MGNWGCYSQDSQRRWSRATILSRLITDDGVIFTEVKRMFFSPSLLRDIARAHSCRTQNLFFYFFERLDIGSTSLRLLRRQERGGGGGGGGGWGVVGVITGIQPYQQPLDPESSAFTTRTFSPLPTCFSVGELS